MTAEVLQHLNARAGGLFVRLYLGLGGPCAAPLLRAGASRIIASIRDLRRPGRQARETAGDGATRVGVVHAEYSARRGAREPADYARRRRRAGGLAFTRCSSTRRPRLFDSCADEPLDIAHGCSADETAADLVAQSSERDIATRSSSTAKSRSRAPPIRARPVEDEREAPVDQRTAGSRTHRQPRHSRTAAATCGIDPRQDLSGGRNLGQRELDGLVRSSGPPRAGCARERGWW